MKIDRKCGILYLGDLEELNEDAGVKIRTSEGSEIVIPLSRVEARAIGVEGLMFKNLKLTIIFEEDPS